MVGLAAGSLDRRVRIERAGSADDGYNRTEVWETLAEVWAQFVPAAGREAREQLGREAQLLATFRIRWSTAVAAVAPGGYRLRFPTDGQVWDIRSVVEIGRRDGIEIIADARGGATS